MYEANIDRIEGGNSSHTKIVGDHNIPLLKMDKTARQKINKLTEDMTNIVDQLELTDTYRM